MDTDHGVFGCRLRLPTVANHNRPLSITVGFRTSGGTRASTCQCCGYKVAIVRSPQPRWRRSWLLVVGGTKSGAHLSHLSPYVKFGYAEHPVAFSSTTPRGQSRPPRSVKTSVTSPDL